MCSPNCFEQCSWYGNSERKVPIWMSYSSLGRDSKKADCWKTRGKQIVGYLLLGSRSFEKCSIHSVETVHGDREQGSTDLAKALVNSMKHRCKSCAAVRDDHTSY
ncbi:hypothetical protein TNCV_4555891 [Trichonephila clavipes]|nr:hypothetical protein TNCV_4555891 [Trichonephila clavipes]